MKLIGRSLEEDSTSTSTSSSSQDVLAPLLSNLFLFFLIFGISATVQVKQVRQQINNKCGLLTGICMQFLVMPLLGFASVKIFQLPEAMGFSLLVVTSSPGGSYSNWWCSLFNADLALSVAMTTVSTIMSMGMLPANLILYNFLAYGLGNDDQDNADAASSIVGNLDFVSLGISLAVVLTAIAAGLSASYKFGDTHPQFRVWASRLASISGVGLIIVSAVFSVADDGANQFFQFGFSFFAGTTFPCLLGIMLATLVTIVFSDRITKPESVAISIECCYQNTGIALSVAASMYSSSQATQRTEALAVALFYSLVEAIIIGFYCLLVWKLNWTKAPASDSFCKVISETYQISQDDEEQETDGHDLELYQEGVVASEEETKKHESVDDT